MTAHVKGERIGAVLGTTDDKVVKYLGVGTYEGSEIPPKEIGGFNVGVPNPKLKLDNGDIVWGCECWWGSEAGIKRKLEIWRSEGYTITTVSIEDERKSVAIVAE